VQNLVTRIFRTRVLVHVTYPFFYNTVEATVKQSGFFRNTVVRFLSKSLGSHQLGVVSCLVLFVNSWNFFWLFSVTLSIAGNAQDPFQVVDNPEQKFFTTQVFKGTDHYFFESLKRKISFLSVSDGFRILNSGLSLKSCIFCGTSPCIPVVLVACF
jgi:hypothetical protein